jgi:hypothetical protein
MTERPSLKELMKAVQKHMRIDFESRTAQLPSPGEKGFAREDVVRAFLRDYLPGRFRVESGFVVDAAGAVSRQIDAIIYDHLAAPRFEVSEGTRVLPIEGVAGVVSVKSYLDTRQLLDAVDNMRSAAQLDRSAGGKNWITFGGVPWVVEAPLHVAAPVLTAVFAFEGHPLDRLALALHQANQQIPPCERLQLVCVLNRGVISYLEGPVFEPTYSLSSTAQVAFVEDAELALPLFYVFLANGVVGKLPIGVSFRQYMELDIVDIHCIP